MRFLDGGSASKTFASPTFSRAETGGEAGGEKFEFAVRSVFSIRVRQVNASDRAVLIAYTLGRLSDADADALLSRAKNDAELARALADLRRETSAIEAERPFVPFSDARRPAYPDFFADAAESPNSANLPNDANSPTPANASFDANLLKRADVASDADSSTVPIPANDANRSANSAQNVRSSSSASRSPRSKRFAFIPKRVVAPRRADAVSFVAKRASAEPRPKRSTSPLLAARRAAEPVASAQPIASVFSATNASFAVLLGFDSGRFAFPTLPADAPVVATVPNVRQADASQLAFGVPISDFNDDGEFSARVAAPPLRDSSATAFRNVVETSFEERPTDLTPLAAPSFAPVGAFDLRPTPFGTAAIAVSNLAESAPTFVVFRDATSPVPLPPTPKNAAPVVSETAPKAPETSERADDVVPLAPPLPVDAVPLETVAAPSDEPFETPTLPIEAVVPVDVQAANDVPLLPATGLSNEIASNAPLAPPLPVDAVPLETVAAPSDEPFETPTLPIEAVVPVDVQTTNDAPLAPPLPTPSVSNEIASDVPFETDLPFVDETVNDAPPLPTPSVSNEIASDIPFETDLPFVDETANDAPPLPTPSVSNEIASDVPFETDLPFVDETVNDAPPLPTTDGSNANAPKAFAEVAPVGVPVVPVETIIPVATDATPPEPPAQATDASFDDATFLPQREAVYYGVEIDAEDVDDAPTISAEDRALAELLGREPSELDRQEFYWEPLDAESDAETDANDLSAERNPSALGKVADFVGKMLVEPPILVGRATLALFGRRLEPNAPLAGNDLEPQPSTRKKRRRSHDASDMTISFVAGVLIAVLVVFPILRLIVKDAYFTIAQSVIRQFDGSISLGNNASEAQILPYLSEQFLFPKGSTGAADAATGGSVSGDASTSPSLAPVDGSYRSEVDLSAPLSLP